MNLAYVADERPDGLVAIDVGDPNAPVVLGSVAVPGALNLAVAHNLAFVVDGRTLTTIDVSDPMNPVILGSVLTPGRALAVVTAGRFAYVADGPRGLAVVDVADPSDPVFVGSIDTIDDATDVAVHGGIVYVAAGLRGGLRAVDVTSCRFCYADCDRSGSLDIFDFLCFQNAFVTMDPYADCDNSTTFDIFDFLCFQDAFVIGCP